MTIQARDRTIERDGGLHNRTAVQISANLWNLWSAGSPTTLRDVDYDQDPVDRTVQVASLNETRASAGHPPDASTIALTLFET
jgi:hypothetical protein